MTALLDTNGKPIKCAGRTYGDYYSGSCSRNASVLRGDKAYCGQHDPVRKAERRAEQNRKWKESFDAKEKARNERREAFAKEIVSCHDYDNALILYDRIRRSYW